MSAPAGVTVTPAGPTHDVATRWQRLRCVKSPLPIAPYFRKTGLGVVFIGLRIATLRLCYRSDYQRL